jgi:adenosylcobinamide-GDP ribazoletransferase
MFSGLRAALQFLTILPLGRSKDFPAQKMAAYFPVAGLIVGLLLVCTDNVFQQLFPGHIVSLLDVIFLAIVTGALHLDGLADTADGLFSHRPPEKILGIMKDSRVGTMGLLAIIVVLAVKWAGIGALEGHRNVFLVVIPAFSRGAFTVAMQCLPYIRPEGGTASAFFSEKKDLAACRWTLLPLALCLLAGPKGLFLMGLFIGIVGLVLFYYKKRLGGITGDMVGALGEVTEASLFLFAAVAI